MDAPPQPVAVLQSKTASARTRVALYFFCISRYTHSVYLRKTQSAPECIEKNAQPLFGTFSGFPKQFDIRGVRRSFLQLKIPRVITDFLVRDNLSFMFNYGGYTVSVDIYATRFIGFCEAVFWKTDKQKYSAQKIAYRSLIAFRRTLIPYNLEKGVVYTGRKSRAVRISWNRSQNRFSLLLNFKGDTERPKVNLSLSMDLTSPFFQEALCVLPDPARNKCRAVYRFFSPCSGAIGYNNESNTVREGSALFDIRRACHKLTVKNEYCFGFGLADNKRIGFSLATCGALSANPNEYNENMLFSDGVFTPLPQVIITHPFGIGGEWIIQDLESMIDLSFKPVSVQRRENNLFIIAARYYLIYGVFNGWIVTKTGEKIVLKDFEGIAKKHSVRL
ncbi:MAG: DUF2804 domain-containing protein [Treponemataceae bacterium]|nr:MAG: DUF2804 domain-containing protein [Treponemataceae bacterium]